MNDQQTISGEQYTKKYKLVKGDSVYIQQVMEVLSNVLFLENWGYSTLKSDNVKNYQDKLW